MTAKPKPEIVPNEDLAKVASALVKFSRVDAGIAALRTRYGTIVYDASTAKGLEAAREARAAVREPRYEVERVRKEAKAPILALGKTLDAEAKRITEALLEIEQPIDAVITAEEERKEREKQARIEAERKRVADIQARIDEFGKLAASCVFDKSHVIEATLKAVRATDIDESFAEFGPVAERAKADAISRLTGLHEQALAKEQEAERLRKEREELDRQRAEQAERERIAREEAERVAAANRAEEKRLADERYRQELELSEQRRRDEQAAAAEKQRLADQEAAQQAEQRRIDEERAELERAKAAAAAPPAAAPEPPQEAEQLAVEAAKPDPAQIVDVVAQMWGVNSETALGWMREIDWQAVELFP